MLRWICTSNPFYVLSAGLFLVGLWISFGAQAEEVQTWSLMSGLAGYTVLLAVTACLLVRFGNVWDDVRTVLLLVVFGIKAALFPLFFWLPDSYPTAPSPVTAIFAGLLMLLAYWYSMNKDMARAEAFIARTAPPVPAVA